MSVGKGFAGGFGGCIGVGCAVVFVLVVLPVGCLMIGGGMFSLSPSARQQAERATQRRDSPTPSSPTTAPPSLTTETTPAERSEQRSPTKEKDLHPTDLVVSDARAVFAVYERNEVQADNDMKNKWFAVKGRVEKIGKDIINTPYVALDVGKEFNVFSVQCMFTDADEGVLAGLRPGQTVVIAGKCAGKMGNVLMRQCWLYDEGARERERAAQQADERRKQAEERRQEEAKRQAAIEEAKWHTWSSADGKFTVEAKFIKAAGDTAHLEKRDGTIIKIPKEKLSDEDWK